MAITKSSLDISIKVSSEKAAKNFEKAEKAATAYDKAIADLEKNYNGFSGSERMLIELQMQQIKVLNKISESVQVNTKSFDTLSGSVKGAAKSMRGMANTSEEASGGFDEFTFSIDNANEAMVAAGAAATTFAAAYSAAVLHVVKRSNLNKYMEAQARISEAFSSSMSTSLQAGATFIRKAVAIYDSTLQSVKALVTKTNEAFALGLEYTMQKIHMGLGMLSRGLLETAVVIKVAIDSTFAAIKKIPSAMMSTLDKLDEALNNSLTNVNGGLYRFITGIKNAYGRTAAVVRDLGDLGRVSTFAADAISKGFFEFSVALYAGAGIISNGVKAVFKPFASLLSFFIKYPYHFSAGIGVAASVLTKSFIPLAFAFQNMIQDFTFFLGITRKIDPRFVGFVKDIYYLADLVTATAKRVFEFIIPEAFKKHFNKGVLAISGQVAATSPKPVMDAVSGFFKSITSGFSRVSQAALAKIGGFLSEVDLSGLTGALYKAFANMGALALPAVLKIGDMLDPVASKIIAKANEIGDRAWPSMRRGIWALSDGIEAAYASILVNTNKLSAYLQATWTKSGGDAAKFAGLFTTDVLDKIIRSIGNFMASLGTMMLSLKNTMSSALGPIMKGGATAVGELGKAMSEVNGKVFQAFKLTLGSLGSDVVGFTSLLESLRTKAPRGFVAITEAAFHLAPAFAALSIEMIKSDNILVKLAGSSLLAASIAFGSMGAIIALLVTGVARLAENIGNYLVSAMESFADKAQKAEAIAAQFVFTMKGFARVMGEESIGSIQYWNDTIKNAMETSTFGMSELQKSVKLLVAEGQALGLSWETNQKLLKHAMDLSAQSGNNLTDVIIGVSKGIAGIDSSTLLSMGINISEVALNHSQFALELGKTTDTMSAHEKQQARLNELYRQMIPLTGAAANALLTVEGQTKKLTQATDLLKQQIGASSFFTMGYLKVLRDTTAAMTLLPPEILSVIGAIIDFTGVTLKIIGFLGSWALTILSVGTAIKLLDVIIKKSIITQMALDWIFKKLTATMTVNLVATTSLSAAWTNLLIVMKGGMVQIIKQLGYYILIATKAMWSFTASILANPLFISGALIATGLVVIFQAVKELGTELGFLSETADENAESVGLLTSIYEALKVAVKATFVALVEGAKLAIIGLTQLGVLAAKARFQLGLLFNPNDAKLQSEIENADGLLAVLAESSGKSRAKLEKMFDAAAGGGTALAAAMGDVSKKISETDIRVKQLNDAVKDINRSEIILELTGDAYDKIALSATRAGREAKKARDEFLKGGDNSKEALEDYKKAIADTYKAEAELSKLRRDSFDKVKEAASGMGVELLKISNRNVEAIQIEFAAKRVALEKDIALAQKAGNVSVANMALMISMRKQLNDLEKAAITSQTADDFAKNFGPAEQMLDNLRQNMQALNRDILEANTTEGKLIDQAIKSQLDAVDQVRQAVGIVEGLNGEMVDSIEQELSRAEGIIKEYGKVKKKKVVGDDTYQSIVKGGEELTSGITDAFTSGTTGMIMAYAKVADMLVDFFQAIVDFLPNFINKVADLINSITDLPKMLEKAIGNLLDAIIKSMKETLSNTIDFLSNLGDMIIEFVEAIPDALGEGAMRFMEAVAKLVDKIPDMIERMITAVLGDDGIMQILTAIMRKAPGIIWKFIKVVMFEMWASMVKGIYKGLKAFFSSVGKFLTGKMKLPDVNVSQKSITDLSKKLTGESSKIFSIKALTDPAKDAMDAIGDRIRRDLKTATDYLKKAWMWIYNNIILPIWNLIVKAWTWVNDNIIQPIWGVITRAWTWVNDNIIQPIWALITNAWTWVNDNIIKPIAAVIQGVWQWVYNAMTVLFTWVSDNIFKPIIRLFEGAFQWINDAILRPIIQAFEQSFGWIKRTIFDPIIEVFRTIFDPVINFFKNFSIPGITGGGGGGGGGDILTTIATGGLNKVKIKNPFAEGGLVKPLYAAAGAFVPQGTDTVPAMLTPGEFVMSRPAVQGIGINNLRAMNSGRSGGQSGPTTVNIELNISTSQNMDEKFIKNKLVPAVKDAMKQASLRGDFVMSKKGVQ